MRNERYNYSARPAELKDVMFFYEAICSIADNKFDINEFNSQYKEKLKDKTYIQLVLEIDDKLIGGCIVAQARKNLSDPLSFIEVQELFIAHKYRKYNAADFLYFALEEKALNLKHTQLRVNCNINSTLNQNFYVKRGFKMYKKQYKKMILV